MTRKELAQHLEAVEAQIRWATLHDGDHELLSLLRIERARFRGKYRSQRQTCIYRRGGWSNGR
jgi:hypothetical protein